MPTRTACCSSSSPSISTSASSQCRSSSSRCSRSSRSKPASFAVASAASTWSRSAALDRRVMEALKSLNDQDGLTVVVTLHQVDYALRYCSRVVALKAGKVVYDGPADGLQREQLIDIYGPEFEDVFWEGAPK